MKRILDILFAILLIIFLCLPIIIIAVIIKTTSKGPILYWSNRVGRDNSNFNMPKFRTMKIGTPEVATHLLENPKQWTTCVGSFFRKTSLDELPQLWVILLGHMSFVGPRPALFNQKELLTLRTEKSIHHLVPGLTGWAQINGRDELSIGEKVDLDAYYLKHKSIWFDLAIIGKTIIKVIYREDVSH